ncbi:MAG: hypothetical protein JSV18_08085 [Candidatus Bathyarchaeota archaeon]|nr:MAG: hypothetical protein JSV18_08085 [Candidatus Bathyarchaeota archaeon]
MRDRGSEHAFSVEMRSKKHVRHISMSNTTQDRVLFEGYLGELECLSMIEGRVLKVHGENGTLRIDLSIEELRDLLTKKNE